MKDDLKDILMFLGPFFILLIVFSQCGCGKRQVQLIPSPESFELTKATIDRLNELAGADLVVLGPEIFVEYAPVDKWCGSYDEDTHRITVNCEPRDVILLHELGHVFGLQHSNDIASIMYHKSVMRTRDEAAISLIAELKAHGL